jgi:phosphoribosylglycinamide formyltransferase 1
MILYLSSNGVRHRYVASCLNSVFGVDNVKYVAVKKNNDHFSNSSVEQWELDHADNFSSLENEYMYSNDLPFPEFTILPDEVNKPEIIKEMVGEEEADVLIFGTPILNEEWFESGFNSLTNIHLGLSPYYTGSGTMFWPFYNNEPDKSGVTLQELGEILDMGKVIKRWHMNGARGNYYQVVNMFLSEVLLLLIKEYSNYLIEKKYQDYSSEEKKVLPQVYKRKDFKREHYEVVIQQFGLNERGGYDEIVTC